MLLPFDPDDVVAYDTMCDQERVIAVKVVLRNGDVRVFEGDALTDEMRQWLQAMGESRAKPPATQKIHDSTSECKSG